MKHTPNAKGAWYALHNPRVEAIFYDGANWMWIARFVSAYHGLIEFDDAVRMIKISWDGQSLTLSPGFWLAFLAGPGFAAFSAEAFDEFFRPASSPDTVYRPRHAAAACE